LQEKITSFEVIFIAALFLLLLHLKDLYLQAIVFLVVSIVTHNPKRIFDISNTIIINDSMFYSFC